jgi:DNA (cytosine-5)-methyltransferase 1
MLGSPASQRGGDFAVMLASLSDLGYAVEWRVINAADYGMPQRRRRVFFIGYKKGTKGYKKIQKNLDKHLFKGTLYKAFPIIQSEKRIESNKITGSLKTVSSKFNINAKKTARSPFKKAGVMIDRVYYTIDPEVSYTGDYTLLGDILQPLKNVPKEFRIASKDLKKWKYHKEAKKIKRKSKATGHEYLFAEGKMSFPDDLHKPSRTVITGEGGVTPSRFKHVVRPGRIYRRLIPVELERLNMFPDNHTKLEGITDGKRAFFMGNALVVGVIEKIGDTLV